MGILDQLLAFGPDLTSDFVLDEQGQVKFVA